MLIHQRGAPGRGGATHVFSGHVFSGGVSGVALPAKFLRASPLRLPEVSELQVVRHYTTLSKKNFSIDTHFYPLGSCTMKYNPRGVHRAAMLRGFCRGILLLHWPTAKVSEVFV